MVSGNFVTKKRESSLIEVVSSRNITIFASLTWYSVYNKAQSNQLFPIDYVEWYFLTRTSRNQKGGKITKNLIF
jgi:hypothetical protein